MNRREFCKRAALLAAGAAALPAQIDAFEALYEVNTRQFGNRTDIIAVRDISFGFTGTPCDLMATVVFSRGETELLWFPINYRGMLRWVSLPDCPLLTTRGDFRWTIKASGTAEEERYVRETFQGTICYLSMDGLIRTDKLTGQGHLLGS